MNKIKKNGFFKAACFMLTVMLLAVCLLSGTMAKYSSTATVSGLNVTVATWDIEIGEESIHLETINLDGLEWTIIPDSGEYPDNNTIAPGTWGYAEIIIENISDVSALVKVSGFGDFTPTETIDGVSLAGSGLSFKTVVNNDAPSNFESAQNGVDLENLEKNGIILQNNNSSDNYICIYVCFKWTLDGDDSADTNIAGQEIEFGTLTITAEQARI